MSSQKKRTSFFCKHELRQKDGNAVVAHIITERHEKIREGFLATNPVDIYLFIVNNRNTRRSQH